MSDFLKSISQSIKVKQTLISEEKKINKAIKEITKSIKNDGKILLCGNGGSAADAQHLAAEFLVRLRPKINRKPIAALALATDTSTLTACGNDYDFNDIFKRNLEALYKPGDILIAITTSGNSKNIINALKFCKNKKILNSWFFRKRWWLSKKIL